jgi:hypothetical protein
MPLRSVACVAALVVAIVGGGFLGFSWCGGYAWHRDAVHTLIATLAFLVIALPPRWIARALRRVGFVISLGATFLVARASAAAFYPATRSSFAEFASHFWASFWCGPC